LLVLLVISFVYGIYNCVPETTFLGHIMLQLPWGYNTGCMLCYFPWQPFCILTVVLCEVCARCPVRLFSVIPSFRVSSCIVQIFSGSFQLPLLLKVARWYSALFCLVWWWRSLQLLFLFVIHLLHGILFGMLDLVLLYFNFTFFFQISPRLAPAVS
jgi:hypothetical protein